MNLAERTATDDQEHAEAMLTIAFVLDSRQGPENAISSQDLADTVEPAATTVRDLIPEVVAEYQIPIGSCPNGYFKIVTDDGIQQELDRRQETIETKREKMRALASAYYGGGRDAE